MSVDTFVSHPLAEQLVQWLTQNGGFLSDRVQIAFNELRGFHMRAVSPLNSPAVVTCPLKLTLSCLNLDPNQKEVIHIDSHWQQCQDRMPDHILTYLLLIEQRNKGKESPWASYIACLPGAESMTTPLWFNEEDMAFLAGTSLAPAARERKKGFQQQWKHAIAVIKDANIVLDDEIEFESLLWAATIFTSRAFISTHILPNQDTVPILFPVVDILNHSVSAKVEWDFQPGTSFTLKLLDGEAFIPGQELFNNYAPKQNDELLLGYGFCLIDNPIEQFPLKLAFPPMLQQYAQETGLFRPENVPFCMSTDFLNKDPNTEQHFLRAKGHPFGRYDNCIPFFSGIPPYIVHFFFAQTLLSLDLDIEDINIQRPGLKITVQVLTLLHQALTQRCSSLPLTIDHHPTNKKQEYAKIYRDGQAKIIHSIRLELHSALSRIHAPAGTTPPSRAILITSEHIIATLPSDLAQKFLDGVQKHNLSSGNTLLWTLLFTCLAAYSLTHKHDTEATTSPWVRGLYTKHALPVLEDGIEDADTYTFVDEHLADFLVLPNNTDATEYLDDIGVQDTSSVREGSALVRGRTENLGARFVMWGMKVAEKDLVSVLDDGGLEMCLYTGDDGVVDDEWMYVDGDKKQT
ncbi:hypothetical protein GQ44DRAFT_606257 [Phaeosphaeriaceae sp. PMI808]|nr:hypothetical protein GQ44DRAFT_606257 [Phaeosphaeriaceae sp. PMI808]